MKETFYFSHDYNARSDENIKRLLRKWGMAGYGVFWSIVEDLYNNANALRMDCEGIAYELRVDLNMVESIINDFDLFVIDGDSFGSLSIQRRLDERNEKSIKARDSARKRWDNANALRTQSNGNAIKEKKRKEKKVKNSIEDNSKTKPFEWIDENFIDVFILWMDYKKSRKESYKNEKSQEAFYNKLIKLSSGSPIKAKDIIEQSMANNWAGIFDLKTRQQKEEISRNGDFNRI